MNRVNISNSKIQKNNLNNTNKTIDMNDPSKLSDLFKEIQDIRYGRAKPEELEERVEEKKEKVSNRKKMSSRSFNAIGVIIGVFFLIAFYTSIHSTYIFATATEEKKAISQYEVNDDPIDVMGIISSNISESTSKEIVTKDVEIPYETKTLENDLLPKDETKIVQTGRLGFTERTSILTYENDELVDEKIINEAIKSEPTEEIIEIGTSEFLANNKVHIGDKMYLKEETPIFENLEDELEIGNVHQYIDVEIISEKDGWANVSIDGIEGYVASDKLTSEEVTPGIAEKARITRILIEVNPEMAVNSPSGLTKEDFKKVLSGNPSDRNLIFEQNAEVFYDMEQKYNINGLFLASIGIHESNWGTSNISDQKKNLFGYGSYDSSSFESSYTFESYEYGINLLAKVLTKYYLNEEGTPIYDGETATGSYYNGPTIAGVNKRYASDPNWATKVYNIMVSLYEKL